MKFLTAKLFILILCVLCSLVCLAQSGRVKPTPEEAAQDTRPRSAKDTSKSLPAPKPTPVPTPTPSPSPADNDDIITIDSVLIPIPVSVTDEAGRSVTNLQIKDFELLVDNKTAEISQLSTSETPVSLALLFDNSGSLRTAQEFELKAATRFLRRVLRPGKDKAALYTIASVVTLEQPLTGDIGTLINTLETLPPPSGATQLLDGIVVAAKYLGEADGRRVIVIVSDGEDNVSEATLEMAVKSVQSRNCQVYVVKTTDFENFNRTGIRTGNANIMNLIAEHRMQELARQTGGAVHSPLDEKELDAAFVRISAELSQQYILSYYPEGGALNSDFHAIALKVKTRAGLTVRTRKGYYVPRKK